ncbi:MAG: carbamoyl-phosphate synthase small subunit [Coxiella sp. (in: Bacteria)]|nr:MAG: carbamoyl-phosphate synthase small subunit [Coxiella sp. (in: g-proteobacteria)]
MTEGVFSLERTPAVLTLADGSVFSGTSIGATGAVVGEVVFNTAMTGYQEILSDPSYAEQIVTLTYPHIGNVGVNADDMESSRVQVAGLVIRELSPIVSNWRAQESLSVFLERHNTIAIADIDTRRLTRILRDKGAQNGCIMAGNIDVDKAIELARSFAGIEGMDLAKDVTRKKAEKFMLSDNDPQWLTLTSSMKGKKVVVYDFGVKTNILRMLASRGAEVIVVPAQTSADDVLAHKPDGVLLSNGPGDPAACDYAIEATKILLDKNIPIFGICLGCQILALACGAKTLKMKFGHHGANHPVKDFARDFVAITSQNHGFAIDGDTLPESLEVTHRSLFDNTVQGIRHKSKPAYAFQGHPEASPGPHDVMDVFDQFMN